jgi:FPC/CPF motif-containing protein YcgG
VTKADERWDAVGDNPLVIVKEIRRVMMEAKAKWAEEVEEFLDDENVLYALNAAVQMISGQIPEPSKVALVVTRLEAISLMCRSQFAAYMSFKKGTTEANMKKNMYKELYTGIDRLVDALKYVAK